MSTVAVSTLPEGSAFRMPWRKEGRNYGSVILTGRCSARVHIPRAEGDGWEDTYWAPTTRVEPTDPENVRQLIAGKGADTRNRSAVESPVALVWRLCEELGGDRTKVIPAATAQGVNISTAKTQFYAWRNNDKK